MGRSHRLVVGASFLLRCLEIRVNRVNRVIRVIRVPVGPAAPVGSGGEPVGIAHGAHRIPPAMAWVPACWINSNWAGAQISITSKLPLTITFDSGVRPA
ncbi:unannotated protein [freshwater metagenome]|uniref:Unannotated protein n=1 Tax=freshwater metagenome TaxID=449393 RepID=A0A6J6GUV2_9ZZZZ